MMYMNIDGITFDISFPAIDRLLELTATEGLIGIFHQLLEQHELATLQIHRRAITGNRIIG